MSAPKLPACKAVEAYHRDHFYHKNPDSEDLGSYGIIYLDPYGIIKLGII